MKDGLKEKREKAGMVSKKATGIYSSASGIYISRVTLETVFALQLVMTSESPTADFFTLIRLLVWKV